MVEEIITTLSRIRWLFGQKSHSHRDADELALPLGASKGLVTGIGIERERPNGRSQPNVGRRITLR
jgi:hypothetical protein